MSWRNRGTLAVGVPADDTASTAWAGGQARLTTMTASARLKVTSIGTTPEAQYRLIAAGEAILTGPA